MLGLDLTFLNWDLLSKFVLGGLRFSVQLTLIATVGGILFGTLLALMRLSGNKVLMLPATIYVNGMRSVPLVMVILWCFLLVPGWMYSYLPNGENNRAEYSAIITFIAFEAAYFSEIMRAGIQSIPRGQPAAAYALGLTYWQSMGHVVLPQAFRNMLPVMLTQAVILFQDTSLVYVVALKDFLGAASKAGQLTGRIVELYLFVAVVFLVICLAASLAVKRLQANLAAAR